MTRECLGGRVDTVVLDTELLAGLGHDGRDLWVVGLDHAREKVVGGLMVEGAREDGPEPAVGGVVLSCCDLHLSPGAAGEERSHNC